jgi:regulator of sigma E protease
MELAEGIGFKTGDQVIKINGKPFEYFDDIAKPDVLLTHNSSYTVLRNGEEVVIPIPTDFIENFDKKNAIASFLLPRRAPLVEVIADTSIAKKVLMKGDLILEVQNQPVTYFDEVKPLLKGDTLHLKIKRGAQILTFTEDFKGKTNIGFYSSFVPEEGEVVVNYSFGEALMRGPVKAFDVIWVQLKAFRKIFSGQLSLRKSISSPIGIAQAYGGVWDWERFWSMTGLLSMVLAFMNLLPIPALDGGYVVFLLYEMISGREPSEKFFENSIKVGMAILLVLMVFAFSNDIIKLVTGG